jgi:hypothetical protein
MRPKAGVRWVTKLRPDLQPEIVPDGNSPGTLLIPTPLLVAEEVRRVRRGRLVTAAEIRERLAARFGADRTCPLTTGIFLSIIAGSAEEQLAAGKRPVAPYWRVVDERGRLNPKFPPGVDRQATHLRREGHRIERAKNSTRWQVAG